MRKPGSRLGLELDLTPMLDVIFIVLMVVMCHQTLDTQTAREELVQLQDTVHIISRESSLRKRLPAELTWYAFACLISKTEST